MTPAHSKSGPDGRVPVATGIDRVQDWVRSDRSIYSGETLHGQPDGRGCIKYPSGAVVTGEFSRGKVHGRAIETRPDGTEYNGEFRFGRREGRGQLRLPDGGVYTGRFFSGCFHQHGTLIRADGSVAKERWSFGRIVTAMALSATSSPSSASSTPTPAAPAAGAAEDDAPTYSSHVWIMREGSQTMVPVRCVHTPTPPPTTPLSARAGPFVNAFGAMSGPSPLPPWQPPPASVLRVWERHREWLRQNPGPISRAPLPY